MTDLNGTGGQDIFWQLVSGTQIKGFLDSGHTQLAVTLDLNAPASIAAGASGNVTVTATLSDNLQHVLANGAQISSIGSVGVVATDTDGDQTTGTVNINVQDDVPTASNEASQNVVEGATVTGTLDFVQGADGATVTPINGTTLVFGGDGFSQAIDIGAGFIKVKADGSYSFTADASVTTLAVPFRSSDLHGDGRRRRHGDGEDRLRGHRREPPDPGTAAAAVDDDGLAGGNPASTAGDIDANAGRRCRREQRGDVHGRAGRQRRRDVPGNVQLRGAGRHDRDGWPGDGDLQLESPRIR